MKLTAIVTLFAVFFLSVHVAVDHGLIANREAANDPWNVSVHDHSHGHSHGDEDDSSSHPGDHHGTHCEDFHAASLVRPLLGKEIGSDDNGQFGAALLPPGPALLPQFVQLDLPLTRDGPLGKPPILLLTQTFLL